MKIHRCTSAPVHRSCTPRSSGLVVDQERVLRHGQITQHLGKSPRRVCSLTGAVGVSSIFSRHSYRVDLSAWSFRCGQGSFADEPFVESVQFGLATKSISSAALAADDAGARATPSSTSLGGALWTPGLAAFSSGDPLFHVASVSRTEGCAPPSRRAELALLRFSAGGAGVPHRSVFERRCAHSCGNAAAH